MLHDMIPVCMEFMHVLLQRPVGAVRVLSNCMHEFHADGDHAMCNIQKHTIPAVQLIEFKILSIKNCWALAFSLA
jgi:hypothetical protein